MEAGIDESEETNEKSFEEFWGWYAAINALSNNDVLKNKEIVDLPLISCLNQISFLMDKASEEERAYKEQMKRNSYV